MAWITAELKASLQALAMSAEVQFGLFPDGACCACELTEDYRHFAAAFVGYHEGRLSDAQQTALAALDDWLVRLFDSSEYECGNREPIRTGALWAEGRRLARSALLAFNWPLEQPAQR